MRFVAARPTHVACAACVAATAVTSLKDVENAAMGYGCDDEEECMLDYDDDDE